MSKSPAVSPAAMAGLKFPKWSELAAAIAAAKAAARADSMASCGRAGCHVSQIPELSACNNSGKLSEGGVWLLEKGSKAEFMASLDQILAAYPGASEVWVDGSVSFAESPHAYRENDYEPYSGEFSILVWEAAS